MIKATYVCDKCGKEHNAELKAGFGFPSTPRDSNGHEIGWSVMKLEWDMYSSLSKLICDDCLGNAGFKGKEPKGDYAEQMSSADKMVDLLLEIANEKGVFDRD